MKEYAIAVNGFKNSDPFVILQGRYTKLKDVRKAILEKRNSSPYETFKIVKINYIDG